MHFRGNNIFYIIMQIKYLLKKKLNFSYFRIKKIILYFLFIWDFGAKRTISKVQKLEFLYYNEKLFSIIKEKIVSVK